MSQIKLKHSGGNSVIIAAPDSNPASDRTLKLPSNADGTVLTTTNPKSGNILQVVQTVKTDSFSTTSTSLVDITGFSVTITPSSSSSKILVMVTIGIAANAAASATCFALLRGSTNIVSNTSGGFTDTSNCFAVAGGGGIDDNERKTISPSITFLDSPSTTSATTYKCQMLAGGGNTGYFNQWGLNTDQAAVSTITAMEVAA